MMKILDKKILDIIPLLLVIAVVPLIVYADVYDPHLADQVWFSYTHIKVDLFYKSKVFVFMAVGMVMTGVLIVDAWKHTVTVKRNRSLECLMIYALLSVL